MNLRKIFGALFSICLIAHTGSVLAEDKDVVGELTLASASCGLPPAPPTEISKQKLAAHLEAQADLEKEVGFWAYYAGYTKLKLSAKDDEDEIEFSEDGNTIIDINDNNARFAQIVFEIPINRMFGSARNARIKKRELDDLQAKEKQEYLSTLADKYLAFKSAVENAADSKLINSKLVYKASTNKLHELRKSAVHYYLQTSSNSDCMKAWMSSGVSQ